MTLFSLVALTFLPLTGVVEGVSVAQVFCVEHKRFFEVFSGSLLVPVPLAVPALSAFEPNPPMLLLRFCSFMGGAWVGMRF